MGTKQLSSPTAGQQVTEACFKFHTVVAYQGDSTTMGCPLTALWCHPEERMLPHSCHQAWSIWQSGAIWNKAKENVSLIHDQQTVYIFPVPRSFYQKPAPTLDSDGWKENCALVSAMFLFLIGWPSKIFFFSALSGLRKRGVENVWSCHIRTHPVPDQQSSRELQPHFHGNITCLLDLSVSVSRQDSSPYFLLSVSDQSFSGHHPYKRAELLKEMRGSNRWLANRLGFMDLG